MVTPGTQSALLAAATVVLGLSIPWPVHAADPKPAAPPKVAHRTVKIDGLDIFYREAGPKDAPTVLLLHGFPTSSHMFRNLIPALADEFHVVAPDYPGFGNSSAPPVDKFDYTFDNLADVVEKFTEKVGLTKYALYVQDYGAPVGYRLAVKHPERVTGSDRAERQRLRRGHGQRLLEADQGVLEGPLGRRTPSRCGSS